MEKLISKIISVETDLRYEGTEFETEEKRGYRVYESHPLAKITKGAMPGDMNLHLGSYKVIDFNDGEFGSLIPVLYCVTTSEDNLCRFVCGLDLINDGRVWVGIGEDNYFDSVDEAMAFVQKNTGKDCIIFLEEKMPF